MALIVALASVCPFIFLAWVLDMFAHAKTKRVRTIDLWVGTRVPDCCGSDIPIWVNDLDSAKALIEKGVVRKLYFTKALGICIKCKDLGDKCNHDGTDLVDWMKGSKYIDNSTHWPQEKPICVEVAKRDQYDLQELVDLRWKETHP